MQLLASGASDQCTDSRLHPLVATSGCLYVDAQMSTALRREWGRRCSDFYCQKFEQEETGTKSRHPKDSERGPDSE